VFLCTVGIFKTYGYFVIKVTFKAVPIKLEINRQFRSLKTKFGNKPSVDVGLPDGGRIKMARGKSRYRTFKKQQSGIKLPAQLTYELLKRIAFYNEFGTRSIPARKLLKTTMYQSGRIMDRELLQAFDRIEKSGTSVEQAMRDVGKEMVEVVRSFINRRLPPPNALSTIAKKGINNTLIDSGTLHDSIQFKYRRAT
jgi:hypothetical protein